MGNKERVCMNEEVGFYEEVDGKKFEIPKIFKE